MSSPATAATVLARQGDTLDALLHRHTGRTAANTEATLAANPGLADLGAVLPVGTAVRIVIAPQQTKRGIYLWD